MKCVVVGWFLFAAGCNGSATTPKTTEAWQAGLKARVQGATSLRITIRGGCEGSQHAHANFSLDDPAAIQEVVELIEIEFYNGRFLTMCSGNDTIEFLKNDKSLVTLVWNPLRLLTWHEEVWKGDAMLTEASLRKLAAWFSAREFTFFTDYIAAAEEAAARKSAADDAFVASFPEEARKLILIGNSTNGKIDTPKVLQSIGSSRQALTASCRSLGSLRDSEASWSMNTPLSRAVLSIAHHCQSTVFWDSVNDLSDDQDGLIGAGRLFFFEKIGRDEGPPQHIDAIIRLAQATLINGYDENKPIVMRHLNRMNHPQIAKFFRQIANDEVGTEIVRKNHWNDEPGIRAHAVLGLALQREKISDNEWQNWSSMFEQPADQDAVQIAGCLWGKGPTIEMRHFRKNSGTLGLGAIEALVRTPSPASLGMLATAGLDHPWGHVRDVAELEIEQMISEKWERHERRRKIEEWLGTHSNAWINPKQ